MSTQPTMRKYRAEDLRGKIIAFSIAYQEENLLERGLGVDHLRELLTHLARPLLRRRASLAYGGNWEKKEREDDNFTYVLLKLISAEQAENELCGSLQSGEIGKMYNHSAWPHYLTITPNLEASWINSCRIIRVTQQDAGLDVIVPDANAHNNDDRTLFNQAVTVSAMRRLSTRGMSINIPDAPMEVIPPISDRIVLGGKLDRYTGFLPGIFEESLQALELGCPLYILGGFGGAAEVLAEVLTDQSGGRPEKLTLEWIIRENKGVAKLLESAKIFSVPKDVRLTSQTLDALYSFVEKARNNLAGTLQTGLTDDLTRELMFTRDVKRAVQLTLQGIAAKHGITIPAA